MNKNEETGEIVLYQPEGETKLEVRVEKETVWLTQAQIADLFGTKRPAITKHLKNIYASQELDEDSTCSVLEHMETLRKKSTRKDYLQVAHGGNSFYSAQWFPL